ncbi:MAG: hydrogenase-4 component E [Methylocystaceae bacterium]|nr:hydrogenase-4 component E [Methylocystaceae bacterium]NBT97388.1 hydrogenase-4 component E [Methylocystaceae bacterium]
MSQTSLDIAQLLAGMLLLVSFLMLYQDRLSALINRYALQAMVLAASVAWQAYTQHAAHLYVTAAIALIFKALIIPLSLHKIVKKLRVHRTIEIIGGLRITMALGVFLTALSLVVMLPATTSVNAIDREDLAFAMAVVLLGLLMMVTRSNVVSQVIGFMSLENGLILAAAGADGMPLVVEISVAFSVIVAFIVIGIFLFRIRERFDTVNLFELDRVRGERR